MMAARSCAAALAAAMLLTACARSAEAPAAAAEAKQVSEEKAAAVPITTAAVSVQPSMRLVHFVGTLYGNQEVTLSSQVEGQMRSLSVDLGDHVAAGQVVAQIEDDEWLAKLREAEATLAKARADEARGRQLVDGRVISTQEYESMKTQAAVAQAHRDTLEVTIRHAHVTAPVRGAIARRFISAGEYVRPGTPLFTVVDDDPLKLRGDVPERFAHELRTGQTVQVRVDAFPDQVFTGRLTRISPASNPENRSVAIETIVDNAAQRLKPGFYANAAVVTRSDDRALMVPQEALITFAGVTKLFVVQDGVVRERQVHTGNRGSSGLVEITDGLDAAATVATSGLTKLGDGIAVTVRDAGTTAVEDAR